MDIKFSTGKTATFPKATITPSRLGLVSVAQGQEYVMKVELAANQHKNFDLRGEAGIIKMLNDRKCKTCVELVDFIEVSGNELFRNFPSELEHAEVFDVNGTYPAMVTKAYPFMRPACTQDMAMAIIEQKKLGVWHGDLTFENTLIDPLTHCIKFIDYDQAVLLDDEKILMGNAEYFDWLDEHARSTYGQYDVETFTHNLEVSREEYFDPFFDGDSFNIGKTLLFTAQETTLSTDKIYHSFRTNDIYAEGERSLDDRLGNLDKLDFEPGERVLDVGCNAGLLCHYLHDRGCDVTGIDIDSSVIEGAQIIANIIGKPEINFNCLDIDDGGLVGYFDTVFLFSVIHHTKHLERNARMIAKSCDRLVIECRCNERGAKPVDGTWIETSVWSHDNVEELIIGLEALFPGFRHQQTLGQGDRDRYMFEFRKVQ